MGQAVSTSALWGAKHLLGATSKLDNFEAIIDSAFMPAGLGPMLLSPVISKCLDELCLDSNLPLLQLAELQDHRVGGVMTPLI